LTFNPRKASFISVAIILFATLTTVSFADLYSRNTMYNGGYARSSGGEYFRVEKIGTVNIDSTDRLNYIF
jgi:hypothetical protein